MSVNSVTNGYSTTATNSPATEAVRDVNNDLGKDAFLKILITQLSNQDPLDPLKDKDFIAQMAQFSTLEQMTNMNKSIEQMAALNKASAVSYIGRIIEYMDDDGLPAYSQVGFVRFENGKVILNTADGDVPLEKVISVA
ncbi:MAG: flagellar hook assembly protein FlgD [Synergistaceae bacterium]|nr:flagellar hook capping FlgD N-terminal domain-containing protein [Synergistota bacterium]NLM70846.1 flagellar hook assembly protein FlgD [Synergistaceae bacterium]